MSTSLLFLKYLLYVSNHLKILSIYLKLISINIFSIFHDLFIKIIKNSQCIKHVKIIHKYHNFFILWYFHRFITVFINNNHLTINILIY
jgi:hypothetical protein